MLAAIDEKQVIEPIKMDLVGGVGIVEDWRRKDSEMMNGLRVGFWVGEKCVDDVFL